MLWLEKMNEKGSCTPYNAGVSDPPTVQLNGSWRRGAPLMVLAVRLVFTAPPMVNGFCWSIVESSCPTAAAVARIVQIAIVEIFRECAKRFMSFTRFEVAEVALRHSRYAPDAKICGSLCQD